MKEVLKSTDGNNLIREKIMSGEPFIASKMGAVEQSIITLKINGGNYNSVRTMASFNAGITPSDDDTLEFFSEKYIKGIKNTDIMGAWGHSEHQIINHFNLDCELSELRYLEPFYFENPWSESLKDKKVLIIHPFEETITNQFKIKDSLFDNKKILPDFELLTIKAEQTNGGGLDDSKPFQESLKIMEDKMDNIDFDIAIIGCGAYGLLLSDYAKNLGKQAVHIGGGLQIMFGVKGKRWDNHPDIGKMYNKNWVRPRENEKTRNIQTVEGGTYW